MSTIKTNGVEIFYRDWGGGQLIVFSHGWPTIRSFRMRMRAREICSRSFNDDTFIQG